MAISGDWTVNSSKSRRDSTVSDEGLQAVTVAELGSLSTRAISPIVCPFTSLVITLDSPLNTAIERFAAGPEAEADRDNADEKKCTNAVREAFLATVRKNDFRTLVEFLKSNGDSQVLASPSALVDENEEHRITITETRFVQNTTVQQKST